MGCDQRDLANVRQLWHTIMHTCTQRAMVTATGGQPDAARHQACITPHTHPTAPDTVTQRACCSAGSHHSRVIAPQLARGPSAGRGRLGRCWWCWGTEHTGPVGWPPCRCGEGGSGPQSCTHRSCSAAQPPRWGQETKEGGAGAGRVPRNSAKHSTRSKCGSKHGNMTAPAHNTDRDHEEEKRTKRKGDREAGGEGEGGGNPDPAARNANATRLVRAE
jgi:hypothetical protein